ncbi:MAG: ATP-binding cassette domain-containing protein [Chloroflexi bacterium]|nr:ATP-binding cassette domain-containing protein [Chloroflexota bacterium]
MSVRHLSQTFAAPVWPWRKSEGVIALDDVSFAIARGEVVGLVGESGSGKTTVGRIIVRLQEPTSGQVIYQGRNISTLKRSELAGYRRAVQMVFQNPFASLNPRRRIGDLVRDPLEIHRIGDPTTRNQRVREMFRLVGLADHLVDRYPHELSSGQRQRVGIARSLAAAPSLIVADEPVSALDVSVQAQVLNLFVRLRAELDLTVLFISHDLRVVRFLCDRIIVLYLGRVMEAGSRDDLLTRPTHPYTKALIASVPSSRPGEVITGDIAQMPPNRAGCVFAPRCRLRAALNDPQRCVTERPELRLLPDDRTVACHFAELGSGSDS